MLQPAHGSGLGLLLWSWCQVPSSSGTSTAQLGVIAGVPISNSSSSSSDQLKLSSESSSCAAPGSSVFAASFSCSPQDCNLLWGSSSLAQEPGLALQSVISTLAGTMLTKLFSTSMVWREERHREPGRGEQAAQPSPYWQSPTRGETSSCARRSLGCS